MTPMKPLSWPTLGMQAVLGYWKKQELLPLVPRALVLFMLELCLTLNMSKVILSGYILVPEIELFAVKQALIEHIENTQAESGCLVFEVVQSAVDTCRFGVYEEFVDAAAFALHQQSVAQSDWGKVTANVQRHYQVSGG